MSKSKFQNHLGSFETSEFYISNSPQSNHVLKLQLFCASNLFGQNHNDKLCYMLDCATVCINSRRQHKLINCQENMNKSMWNQMTQNKNS